MHASAPSSTYPEWPILNEFPTIIFNLREKASILRLAVRDFLTAMIKGTPKVFQGMLFPLLAVCLYQGRDYYLGADNKKNRIVKFRELMSKEQKLARVGENMQNFYAGIVTQAEKALDDQVETPCEKELLGAFETLLQCVWHGTSANAKRPMADVFIAFDEARLLTEVWGEKSGLSNYIGLQRVL